MAAAAVSQSWLIDLREICLRLPDAFEEQAWTGVRWKVRSFTFAHVLTIVDGRPDAYARAVGAGAEPITVLTFRTPAPEAFRDGNAQPPFFWPGWFGDLAGIVLGNDTDLAELSELITESYCVGAPKKLVARVAAIEGWTTAEHTS